MLVFKEIELSDKPWVDACLRVKNSRMTEYCFTTLFMWAESYGTRIARYGDWLVVRSMHTDDGPVDYLFPAGSGDPAVPLQALVEDARQLGRPFRINCLTTEDLTHLEDWFPGMTWEVVPLRDSFDYIYHREDLLQLRGKKYQAKRNFISRFLRNADWSYERMDPTDSERCARQLAECLQMNRQWCLENGCRHNQSLHQETCAGRKVLQHFQSLGLRGGILRLNGEMVAYTIGEPLNEDTFIVHIEKAFSRIDGAYPMINRSFVEAESSGMLYINREDDAGQEGLRKAKLSYHPAFLQEKFTIVPVTD